MATDPTSAPSEGTRQRLAIWLHEDPPTLDPQGSVDEWSWRLHTLCYEGLARRDPHGRVPAGSGLAESWEVSDDARTWTFTLRPGLRWSDGQPLTVEHARHAFLRSVDPRAGRRSAWQMYVVEGARACHRLGPDAGAEIDAALERLGVEVVGPRRLRLRLAAPLRVLPDLLALPSWAPLRADLPPAHDAAGIAGSAFSGPLVLASYEPGVALRFRRNPRYWDAGRVALDRVDVRIGGDPVQLYREGHVDVVPLAATAARTLDPAEVTYAEEASVAYLVCNTRDPLMGDRDARLAVAAAIDRAGLAAAGGVGSRPATGLVPAAVGRGAFRDAAGTVLAAAPAGARLPEGARLRLLCGDAPHNVAEARTLAAQVERHCGVSVAVEVTGLSQAYYRLRDGDYQLAIVAWKADYDDAVGLLAEHVSDGAAGNQSKWSDAEYDALVARARATADPAARQRLLVAAERKLVDFAAVQPLLYRGRYWAVRPGVRGVVHVPFGPSPELRWAARGVPAPVA